MRATDLSTHYDVIDDGVKIFTAFADAYGDKIEDGCKAEEFFKLFMEKTGGQVILDFLDADNDDRIESISFDDDKKFLKICTRIPENDPIWRNMRKMALPFDTYSLLIHFKNLSFVRIKGRECVAVVVIGYTLKKKQIEGYVRKDGAEMVCYEEKDCFFSSDVVCKKDDLYEFMRAMTTPISSIWILPKQLSLNAQVSKRLLYLYNIDLLKELMDDTVGHLQGQLGEFQDKDTKDRFIKMYGNQLRDVTEALFKLVVCFYHDKYDFKGKDTDYNDRLLGDLIGSLKKFVYKSKEDKERFGAIARVANELSHDAGLPVKVQDFYKLHGLLKYYLEDFTEKVNHPDGERWILKSAKPSPHDFIEKNLKVWDFSPCIKDIDRTPSSNCAFLLKIKPSFAPTNWLLNEDDYLCKDGKIHTLKNDDLANALVIPNRDALVKLEENIYGCVKEKCDEAGYDAECSIIEIYEEYIQLGKPMHLFTLDEITQLMREATDEEDNKLVIDENGYAHLIHQPWQGCLYPVSIEAWCAGNHYVGENSSLGDAEPSYQLCLDLWLRFLQTKRPQYDDFYRDVDVEGTIGEIMKILANKIY